MERFAIGYGTELLGFTRQASGHRVDTQMDRWLEDVTADFDLPKGITFDLHLDSDVTLEIDRERLRRALTNLFSNSVHAMDAEGGRSGTGVLTVSCAVNEQRLEIRVRDTGDGIAPELREQIFEPLFSTRAFGFGLGLPFVRQVVEQQHEGGVQVVDVDTGTEMLVWLPLPAEASQ